jgi:hypothetical protein
MKTSRLNQTFRLIVAIILLENLLNMPKWIALGTKWIEGY